MRITTKGIKTTKSAVKTIKIFLPKKHLELLIATGEQSETDIKFFYKFCKMLANIVNTLKIEEEEFDKCCFSSFTKGNDPKKGYSISTELYIGFKKKPFKFVFNVPDPNKDQQSHITSSKWDSIIF
jgi:hypothetical protein